MGIASRNLNISVQMGDVEHFLEKGPDFIFLFHPALGPLWHVIGQKLRGGAINQGSELVLEVNPTFTSTLMQSDPHDVLKVLSLTQNLKGSF